MIRTKNVIFDESVYYDSSEIDVVRFQESIIKQFIEISRIQETSRIIEIEPKSKSDLDIKQIQSSNKKEKRLN